MSGDHKSTLYMKSYLCCMIMKNDLIANRIVNIVKSRHIKYFILKVTTEIVKVTYLGH